MLKSIAATAVPKNSARMLSSLSCAIDPAQPIGNQPIGKWKLINSRKRNLAIANASDQIRLCRRERPAQLLAAPDLHKLAAPGHRVEDAGGLRDDIPPRFPTYVVQPFRARPHSAPPAPRPLRFFSRIVIWITIAAYRAPYIPARTAMVHSPPNLPRRCKHRRFFLRAVAAGACRFRADRRSDATDIANPDPGSAGRPTARVWGLPPCRRPETPAAARAIPISP